MLQNKMNRNAERSKRKANASAETADIIRGAMNI